MQNSNYFTYQVITRKQQTSKFFSFEPSKRGREFKGEAGGGQVSVVSTEPERAAVEPIPYMQYNTVRYESKK